MNPLKIPMELQRDIIDCCFAQYHHNIHRDIPHTVLPLLLVCRNWSAYALPLLYRRVYLGRYSVYLDFVRSTKQPTRANLVRHVAFSLMTGERSIGHLLKSRAIELVMEQCREMDTLELVIDWDITESIPVMTTLANCLRSTAKPIRFIWMGRQAAQSLFFFVGSFPETSTRPKLQRVECRLDPHSLMLARRFQGAPYLERVVCLVDFSPDNLGEIRYGAVYDVDESEGGSEDEEDDGFTERVLRPRDFFATILGNPKLLSLSIVSLPRTPEDKNQHVPGQAEREIMNWIAEDQSVQSRVSFRVSSQTIDELDVRRKPRTSAQ